MFFVIRKNPRSISLIKSGVLYRVADKPLLKVTLIFLSLGCAFISFLMALAIPDVYTVNIGRYMPGLFFSIIGFALLNAKK